jgi:hypothetical protein
VTAEENLYNQSWGHSAFSWEARNMAFAALPYLMTAADGAVAVGANLEAIAHLQTALELTALPGAVSPQQRNAIRLKLAGLHFVVGER